MYVVPYATAMASIPDRIVGQTIGATALFAYMFCSGEQDAPLGAIYACSRLCLAQIPNAA